MFSLFNRKHKTVVVETPQEVVESKEKMKQAANAASENTQKVKSLLGTDHITLRIHSATRLVKHV